MSISTKLSAFVARVAEQFKTVTADIDAVTATANSTKQTVDGLGGVYAPIDHHTPAATASIRGHVTVSDATNSTSSASDGVAASPKAVKAAYDLANAALPKSGGTVSGNLTVSGTFTATVAMSNVSGLSSALDAKAPLASPTFTGTPKAPTATAGTNTTQVATTAFVTTAVANKKSVDSATKATQDASGNVITATYATKNELATAKSEANSYTDTVVANLVNSAPETLDTLGEIATALQDNVEVVDALNAAIGNKANSSEVVKLSGNQTIAGTKTFSSTISGSISGNAATATKATQDASGNVIASTYATKTELTNGLAGKLNTSGGNVSGHVYLTGAKENSSTSNTSQLVFGTPDDNHVAISSNTHALVINPNTSQTSNQIVLYLDKASIFPSGISANITGSLTGTASNATQAQKDGSGNVITSTYATKTELGNDSFVGKIEMFYGTLDSTGKYPLVGSVAKTNWQICDGTNGTPDLRNKFVMGAGNGTALGSTGGSSEAEIVDQSSFDYSMSTGSVDTEMEIQTELPPYVALYYIMKIA